MEEMNQNRGNFGGRRSFHSEWAVSVAGGKGVRSQRGKVLDLGVLGL